MGVIGALVTVIGALYTVLGYYHLHTSVREKVRSDREVPNAPQYFR